MASTALYGLVHSLIASLAAKRTASRVFGTRNRNGLYRVFYIAQAFVTFALFYAYARRQPSRMLYDVQQPYRRLMHGGQVLALVYATWTARQVGIRRITGLASARAWLTSSAEVEAEPEAQGPALDTEGRGIAIGPFAWSRHPLNFAPVPIFWLWPRVNTNILAFNLVATAYLALGSLHEEHRLKKVHGQAYVNYQRTGTSFYLPKPRRSPLLGTDAFVSESIPKPTTDQP